MSMQWARVRLNDLTEQDSPITYGVVKPGDEGTIRFVRGGDISDGGVLVDQLRTITAEVSDQYSRTLLRGGELLMCLVGQPGQVAIAPDTLAGANIARQVGLIRLRSEFNAEFIKYFLQSPDGQECLGAHTGGSVQQVINLGDLRTVEIPLPSPTEQQRIVAMLDEAFAGIATARAAAEQNRQNARALFESHLQSVFSQGGEGWVERSLGELSRINYGHTESASLEKIGPKFLRITDIQNNAVNWGSVPYCQIEAINFPKYQLAHGDIVFARTGATTGKSYLVKNPPEAVFASYLIRLRLKEEDLLPEFLNLFFQTHTYWDNIRSGVSGSAQGGFNATKLSELAIPFPLSPQEQQTIVAKLDALASETKNLEALYQRKLDALDELKQSLLHQAFSGNL